MKWFKRAAGVIAAGAAAITGAAATGTTFVDDTATWLIALVGQAGAYIASSPLRSKPKK